MARIGIVLAPHTGSGTEKCLVTLANALAAQGHAVELLLLRGGSTFHGQIAREVRVVTLHRQRIAAALGPLVRYLRATPPDAFVTAQTALSCVVLLAARLAAYRGQVLVNEQNALLWDLRHSRSWRRRALRVAIRLTYPRADVLTALSLGVAEDLRTILGEPERVIPILPNPVDIERAEALAAMPIDEPWFRGVGSPLLLAVGRLVEQKDFGTLLAAFAQLRSRVDAHLLILGEGPERKALERRAAELGITGRVHLPGFAPNPFKFMRAAQVFVMSSRWESFGNVLVEALATGASIVSTDCRSGPGEILEGGRWGRLVPAGDPASLARALEQALRHPSPPDLSRQRAAAYSAGPVAQRLVDLLAAARPSTGSKKA